jgi:hypothetical protein
VDAREQSRALQAHLGHARRCLAVGDRVEALKAVEAALAIDPEFLAARLLRENLTAPGTSDLPLQVNPPSGGSPSDSSASHASGAALAELTLNPPSPPASARQVPPEQPPSPSASAHQALSTPSAPALPAAVTSTNAAADGWVRLEQKARQKRIDSQLAAVRLSLGQGSLADARSALDEVRELAPEHPSLASLSARLATAGQHRFKPSAGGRWLAAAAAFAFVVIGVSWLERYQPITLGANDISLPVDVRVEQEIRTAAVVDDLSVDRPDGSLQLNEPDAAPPGRARPVAEAGTSGMVASAERRPATEVTSAESLPRPDSAPVVFERPAPTVPEPAPATFAPVSSAAVNLPNASAPVETPISSPPAAAPVAAVAPAVAIPAPVEPAPVAVVPTLDDEDRQIRQVLERYRSAYERLDARSARQVWPGVNEAALARAFEGLQSQSVTFDACEIRIRGSAATAACSGSARYVPKVGSRFQRVEPRSWDFTLRKSGAEWKIDAARAER